MASPLYEVHYKDSSTVRLITKREILHRLERICPDAKLALREIDRGVEFDGTFFRYKRKVN